MWIWLVVVACTAAFHSSVHVISSTPAVDTKAVFQWYARVAVNEAPIKVTKTEEGLDILHFPRDGPLSNSGNLVQSHMEAIRRQDVAQVFAICNTKLEFQELAVQASFGKAPEHLMNMSCMCKYTKINVKKICEESVEKALEGSR
jgi:hypothetical protein